MLAPRGKAPTRRSLWRLPPRPKGKGGVSARPLRMGRGWRSARTAGGRQLASGGWGSELSTVATSLMPSWVLSRTVGTSVSSRSLTVRTTSSCVPLRSTKALIQLISLGQWSLPATSCSAFEILLDEEVEPSHPHRPAVVGPLLGAGEALPRRDRLPQATPVLLLALCPRIPGLHVFPEIGDSSPAGSDDSLAELSSQSPAGYPHGTPCSSGERRGIGL